LLGAAEAALARRWLEEGGLRVAAGGPWTGPEGGRFLVAEMPSEVLRGGGGEDRGQG
jgi:hypothetical protein